MLIRRILAGAFLVSGLLPAHAALGQIVFPGIPDPVITYNVELNEAASAVRRDLERAEAALKNEQWDEAVEIYRRLIEEESDRVIAVEGGGEDSSPFAVYIPTADYCQMRLARLAIEAPAALALYRERVDPLARQWLAQARQTKDALLLDRTVRTMFASSYGDDALFLRGEIEMERGFFAAARGFWERISPSLRTPVDRNSLIASQPARPLWLALEGLDLDKHWSELAPALAPRPQAGAWFVYPDTDLPLEDVRSRLVLASILEGSPERASVEMEVLKRFHPEAEGAIGGRTGKLHELLSALLRQSGEMPSLSALADWRMFAGSQDRNAKAAREVDLAARPLWVHAFDKTYVAGDDSPDEFGFPNAGPANSPSEQTPTPLASYHPVIVGDVVLYNDVSRIYAVRLGTGEPAWPLGLGNEQQGAIYGASQRLPFSLDASLGRRELGAPRFTLNVHDGKLLARMGSPVTGEPADGLTSPGRGFLVDLDFTSLKPLHEPIRTEGPEWAFEGTPVTDGARLYVALRHSEIRAVAYVACYDSQTGEQLWRRKICSSETLGQGQRREMTHNLLTLAEGTLYYNTNLGAVAALSASDGRVRWVARYPRITRRRDDERQDPRFLRDLNPCVFHKGLILTFPTDCNQIFALDAMSGQFLWATPEESTPDVAHLLGVAGDNLIVGGACLYWLNAYSGRFLAQFPENGLFAKDKALADVHGAGRGVLAGDVIYWPAQTNTDAASETHGLQIQVLRQALRRTERAWEAERVREIDLRDRAPGIDLDAANLVIGNGVLLLATPRRLVAFGE